MLTTISEQSQLLSPKNLLILQRQISISESQQRQTSITSIDKGSNLPYAGNRQISPKHFVAEKDSTYNEKLNSNTDGAQVASNVSKADSTVMDENCLHDGHRTIFSTASVGNHSMIELLHNSFSIILFF